MRRVGILLTLSDEDPEAKAWLAAFRQGLERRGIFAAGELPRLLGEHRRGRRNHAGRLWALLILERWFARYAPDWTCR